MLASCSLLPVSVSQLLAKEHLVAEPMPSKTHNTLKRANPQTAPEQVNRRAPDDKVYYFNRNRYSAFCH